MTIAIAAAAAAAAPAPIKYIRIWLPPPPGGGCVVVVVLGDVGDGVVAGVGGQSILPIS